MELLVFIAVAAFLIYAVSNLKSQNPPKQEQVAQQKPVKKELNYFCLNSSGYYISVWPKDQSIGDYIEFNIAGISYRENITSYLGENEGILVEEPTNQYDPNAIKILANDTHHIGYVPRDQTQYVRQFTTLPCKCYFFIGIRFDEDTPQYYTCCYIKR